MNNDFQRLEQYLEFDYYQNSEVQSECLLCTRHLGRRDIFLFVLIEVSEFSSQICHAASRILSGKNAKGWHILNKKTLVSVPSVPGNESSWPDYGVYEYKNVYLSRIFYYDCRILYRNNIWSLRYKYVFYLIVYGIIINYDYHKYNDRWKITCLI